MSDYLDAYRARLERNQAALVQLIKDVLAKDSSIEAYVNRDISRFIDRVVFLKDESINAIGFHEVPYRWSGCGFPEFGNSHSGGENVAMPFTADDVVSTFKPITKVMHTHDKAFKSKEQYLKWCSYLSKFDTTGVVTR